MAEENPKQPGLFSELVALGRAIAGLVRTVRDIASGDTAAEPLPMPLVLPPAEKNFESAQLLTQRTPGWNVPSPSQLAAPSYAPAMVAFAIVFIALGAVTKWPVSVIGAVIFAAGIAMWIGELLHD